MGPGPSVVPQRVLSAMARPTIGHLDPEFITFMDSLKQLLQRAFLCDYAMTMPVSGPGTAAMEACVVNLLEPGDTIVVCINGVFGRRIAAMAERCQANVVRVEESWGRAINIQRVEETLHATPQAKVLAFVQAETSTGVLSNAKELASLASQHDCLSLADAVTSFGGSPLRVGAWGVDAVYAGTQKCLSAPPGLAPVTVSGRAMEVIKERKHPVQSWFMDFGLVQGYWGTSSKRSYHHTAPINALYGLHEALQMLHEETIELAWDRHRSHHQALRVGLEILGLDFVVPAAERLPQLNLVRVPDGINEASARSQLLRVHGLEIGGGLGDLAGKVWRIGLMGYSCRSKMIEVCLKALAEVVSTRQRGRSAVRAAMDLIQTR